MIVKLPAGHALRLVARALVVEDADVSRPVVGHLEVEAAAEGVFVDVLRRPGAARCRSRRSSTRPAGSPRPARGIPDRSAGDRRHGARPRGGARHRLDEVHAGVQPVALVAAEEERPVLQRSARRSSRRTGSASAATSAAPRSTLPSGLRVRVEVVRRVEPVARGSTRRRSRGSRCRPTW